MAILFQRATSEIREAPSCGVAWLRPSRTIEDRLREEYFQLLPEIGRVAGQLESEINYHLLPIANAFEEYEQLVVKSRVKECESAVDALRRRRGQEGASFDNDQPARYTLADLNDLAGLRILVFPRKRMLDVDTALREISSSWARANSSAVNTRLRRC